MTTAACCQFIHDHERPWLQAWKDWFDSDAPEESQIPNGYSSMLSTFHKLLLIRSWCPDRTIPMAKIYIAETMGKQVLGILDSIPKVCLPVIIIIVIIMIINLQYLHTANSVLRYRRTEKRVRFVVCTGIRKLA